MTFSRRILHRLILTIVVIVLSCVARKANTKPPAEVPGAAIDLSYWDTRINSLQTRLGRDPSDAALWADLGIVRDTIYHQGGSMQPKALEAFRQSLRLSPHGPQAFIVCHRMAILLKTMGANREAVLAHERAFVLADTPEQRATVMEQKGHALWGLGRNVEAKSAFLEAVRLNPCILHSLLPLVTVISEMNAAALPTAAVTATTVLAKTATAPDSTPHQHSQPQTQSEVHTQKQVQMAEWQIFYRDLQHQVQRLELLIQLHRNGQLAKFVASGHSSSSGTSASATQQGKSRAPVFFITPGGAGGAGGTSSTGVVAGRTSKTSASATTGTGTGTGTGVAVAQQDDILLAELRTVLLDANISIPQLEFDVVTGTLADALYGLHRVGNIIRAGGGDLPVPAAVAVAVDGSSVNENVNSRHRDTDSDTDVDADDYSRHKDVGSSVQTLWTYLQQANEIERKRKPSYDPTEAAKKTAVTMTVFSPGFWSNDIGHPSSEPLFIIGFLRCGSVVLENLLKTHSKIASIGEDSIFNGYLPDVRNGIVHMSNTAASQAEVAALVEGYGDRVIRDMRTRVSMKEHMESLSFRVFDDGPPRIISGGSIGDGDGVGTTAAPTHVPVATAAGSGAGAGSPSSSSSSFSFTQRLFGLDRLRDDDDENEEEEEEEEQQDSDSNSDSNSDGVDDDAGDDHKGRQYRYILDRMVFNYRNVGFIHLLYPTAPILHVIRDPMDTILSVYQNKFDDAGLVWSTDLDYILLEYIAYLTEMAHWRRVLPNRLIEVVYEQVMMDPEAALTELLENQLYLQMEPAMRDLFRKQVSSELGLDLGADPDLNFDAAAGGVADASMVDTDLNSVSNNISFFRQKPHTRRIGHWRAHAVQLKPTIKRLKQLLGPLKQQEGGLPFLSSGAVNWNCRVDHPVYTAVDAANIAADAAFAAAETAVRTRRNNRQQQQQHQHGSSKTNDRTRTSTSSGSGSGSGTTGTGVPKWFPQTKFDGRGSRVSSPSLKQQQQQQQQQSSSAVNANAGVAGAISDQSDKASGGGSGSSRGRSSISSSIGGGGVAPQGNLISIDLLVNSNNNVHAQGGDREKEKK